MHPLKRRAALMVLVAGVFAVLTPLYVSYAAPSESVYHRNATVLLMQALPYAVCALLWLPARSESAPRIFYRFALGMVAVAALTNGAWWINPGPRGDMVGLGYILVCLVLTGLVVVASIVAFVGMRWKRT